MTKMNFRINDISLTLKLLNTSKITILEACLNNGIYIPHFCYNKYLLIAGNCRICIVEIEKFIKPIISCLNLCVDNLSIYTNSFALKKFRENVLEFLLINHPLDCPICDQAGECDLQEQTLKYGLDKSRFFYVKKTNSDIILNNYIKLILNRCILCVRCVRFLRETNLNSSYKDVLGTIGRGYLSKIHLYKNTKINLLGSANIIDICPVGALTLKVNQFSYRPWELLSILSFDIFDSFGLPIKIDFKKDTIIRILPYLDSIFSIDFISDLTRFKLNTYKNLYQMLTQSDFNNELKINIPFNDSTIIINISKNPLISFSFIKNLITKLNNLPLFFTDNICNYLNFNNSYLLSQNLLNELNFSKIFININFKKYMYRFSLYLNEINTKYNNIIYYINEDLKLLNIYNILNLKEYIKFTNNLENLLNEIFIIKFLNFFKLILNFDNISALKYLELNYKIINDIINIDFNTFNKMTHIINIFTFKNYKFDTESLFNVLGMNVLQQELRLTLFLFLIKELLFTTINIKYKNNA